MFVRCEQDLLAIGRERGRKARAAEIGDLLGVLAIAIGHPQLHLHRSGEVFFEQRLIGGLFLIQQASKPHY